MPKEIDAITKLYDYILWIIPKLERFPRSQKFILADRIETLMLDILDLLIEAAYTRNKRALLRSANLKLEKLRYLGFRCASTFIFFCGVGAVAFTEVTGAHHESPGFTPALAFMPNEKKNFPARAGSFSANVRAGCFKGRNRNG